jgi:hypothetical protein
LQACLVHDFGLLLGSARRLALTSTRGQSHAQRELKPPHFPPRDSARWLEPNVRGIVYTRMLNTEHGRVVVFGHASSRCTCRGRQPAWPNRHLLDQSSAYRRVNAHLGSKE